MKQLNTYIHNMFQGCVKFKGKGLEKWPINEKVDTYNLSLCGCYRIENKPNWYKQKIYNI